MTSLLYCQQLSLQMDQRQLIKSLHLRVKTNECWVILGPNGVGKTQLLYRLSGLKQSHPADAIQLLQRPLSEYPARRRAQLIGLVMQQHQTGLQHTVLDMVLNGYYPHQTSYFWDHQETIAKAQEMLEFVGIDQLAGQSLTQISGGERRRAEIARLLMQNPKLAILDEPLNHLDIGQQIHILRLLKHRFVNEQRALILVLHDLNLARQIATHCLLLFDDGNWLAGSVETIATRDNFSQLMGYDLVEYTTQDGAYLSVGKL
jgi:iron complex transport system ATP-binding protein